MKSPKPPLTLSTHISNFDRYRTMLNFYPPFLFCVLASHFENDRHLENFENAELLYHYPVRSYQH